MQRGDGEAHDEQFGRRLETRRDVLRATAGTAVLGATGTRGATARTTTQEETDDDNPSVSGGIFDVHYPDGYEPTAREMLQWARDVRASLRQEFPDGVGMGDEPVKIYLNEGDVGGKMNWNAGPYRIHAQVIQNARIEELEYRRVLGHEFMNIVLNYHSQKTVGKWPRSPLWFREGLSDYYTYNHISDEITRELFPSRFIQNRYEEIRNGLGYFELMTQNRYSGGYLILRYTIEEFGLDPVFDVLTKDGDWESDIAAALGVSYDEWRRSWLAWAEANVGGTYNAKVASISELDSIIADQRETIDRLRDGDVSTRTSIAAVVSEIEVGQSVVFDAAFPSDADIESVQWTFGDGTSADRASVAHAYDTPGDYEARMTARLTDGTEFTKSRQLTVVAADTARADTPTTPQPTDTPSTPTDSPTSTSGESRSTDTAASTQRQTTLSGDETTTEGPGFDLVVGLSALGGVGSLLKRRLGTGERDE